MLIAIRHLKDSLWVSLNMEFKIVNILVNYIVDYLLECEIGFREGCFRRFEGAVIRLSSEHVSSFGQT